MAVVEFFEKNWIRMIIVFSVGLVIMALYNVSYAASGAPAWTRLEYYRDGSFITAMSLFFVGLLVLIAHFGLFDIFSFFAGRKRKENGQKENFGDYVERKRNERSHFDFAFLAYILVSLVFLAFSLTTYFYLQ